MDYASLLINENGNLKRKRNGRKTGRIRKWTKRIPADIRAAKGVATPADAALMMQLGAEGVFVGSGIFKSGNPAKRTAAIVKAVTNYKDAVLLPPESCRIKNQ